MHIIPAKKTDFIIVITLDSLEFNYLLCFDMFLMQTEEIMSFGFLGMVLVEARSPQSMKII
jgi:hypothetical protein